MSETKKRAAEKAVEYVTDGMIVGLGTGSTAYWAIQKIGKIIREGMRIRAIATSSTSEALAKECGIPLVPFSEIDDIDVTIDGADEVDPAWNLIKGGGGALLREKIVAAASKRLIIIVDESKLVTRLGEFALPVEVVPFGFEMTQKKLTRLGCRASLRQHANQPFITDNGNFIFDCDFGMIDQSDELHDRINTITGVVDNGLFIGMADRLIVGFSDGTVKDLSK